MCLDDARTTFSLAFNLRRLGLLRRIPSNRRNRGHQREPSLYGGGALELRRPFSSPWRNATPQGRSDVEVHQGSIAAFPRHHILPCSISLAAGPGPCRYRHHPVARHKFISVRNAKA